ncbi:hypothetical protein OGAPHI_003069 [Ogataea philodendri]|uniref:Probable endonuclease LCL3 n=1 Tax=Ogataea philodendri TaxID=1378263 RepID=A0A9P8P9E0_9ASCO|nr:uncharacterized protein OGAPHI_003069 [Ogataea philodendri]KAH3667420.1 hypothetical protein OGAPHI_003069 [Ogataea philodendri]
MGGNNNGQSSPTNGQVPAALGRQFNRPARPTGLVAKMVVRRVNIDLFCFFSKGSDFSSNSMSDVSLTHPLVLLYGFGTASVVITGYAFYSRNLKRINLATDIPNYWFRRRYMFGKVTSVGDGDNFHFFHMPGGRLAGWGWLRQVPEINTFRKLKNRTVSVRLCGVDAPERAHFGKPAQPFSEDALQWLRDYILGRTLYVKPLSLDQYHRVVSKVMVLKWNGFRDVSEEMIKHGIGTVYEAKHGTEFDGKEPLYRAWEKYAKREKLGLWKDKNKKGFVSPRQYKDMHKTKQVGEHHHPDVDNGPESTQMSEPPLVLVRFRKLGGYHFWEQEQHHEPAPDQQSELDIVPNGDKREHRQRSKNPALRASKWHVHVSDDPLIVRAVPGTPELHRGVVVVHASNHIFRGVDAVAQGPESKQSPWNQQLEPNNIQIEQTNHRDLEWRVSVPGFGLGNSNNIDIVENELHQ